MKEDKNGRVIAIRTGKTLYRDGESLLKVFDRDYSKSDILNEALNQSRVEETGLNIPKVLEVLTVDGKWAIRREFVEGKSLAELMDGDPKNAQNYLDQLVDIQKEVFSRRAPLLNRLNEKLERQIAGSILSHSVRYDLSMKLSGMEAGDSVCHGDFVPSNIVIDAKGRHWILDWSHATQGNPEADVARSYLLFWLAGKIDAAEAYLDAYCRKTGTEKHEIQKWIPIVAAAQSTKGSEEQREFLLHWASVMDYE